MDKSILWLSMGLGINNRKTSQLIDYFEGIDGIWNTEAKELEESGILNAKEIESLVELKSNNMLDMQIEYMRGLGVSISLVNDKPEFKELTHIYNPPSLLYSKGEVLLEDKKSIAIVGARRCTQYGMEIAYDFGKKLARNGFTVISGMAEGIDTYAHRGAIAGGGRTIAVLGCGLDICYPRSNKKLMDEIVDNGAVLSEYPLGTQPLKQYFPIRNRIISGLSSGILVVEAGEKSGTLITVEHGLGQGKDIFSIPGNIISSVSKGTNRLIKEGAKMVTDIDDILEEYDVKYPKKKEDTLIPELSDKEHLIYDMLKLTQPIGYEALQAMCELTTTEFNGYVGVLEIKGYIKQLPGKILMIGRN